MICRSCTVLTSEIPLVLFDFLSLTTFALLKVGYFANAFVNTSSFVSFPRSPTKTRKSFSGHSSRFGSTLQPTDDTSYKVIFSCLDTLVLSGKLHVNEHPKDIHSRNEGNCTSQIMYEQFCQTVNNTCNTPVRRGCERLVLVGKPTVEFSQEGQN